MSKNAHSNPQSGSGQPLPKKESDLFRTVIKHYESKQYKKATKAADSILKKFPTHGETLCMKGLILNSQGKKFRDEAISMVKLGLMNDMRSHVCWHVYGLIYRSERNYNEAIKAYKQALRIDKQNHQILKDLALLQIQMRDLEGFTKTQHAILDMKPSLKGNWLAFALGKHMSGDLRGAVNVLDIFLGTLEEGSIELQRNFETSELAMYKNSILAEIAESYDTDDGGNWKEALQHLEECKGVIVDRLGMLKMKGFYQLQLKKFKEAKESFMNLLVRGSTEDYSVHTGYMCAVLEIDTDICRKVLKKKSGAKTLASIQILTPAQISLLKKEYQTTLKDMFAKSIAVKRITISLLALDIQLLPEKVSKTEHCKCVFETYIQTNIKRGVPSLGEDLSALFLVECPINEGEYRVATDPVDIKTHPVFKHIVSLVDEYMESLSENISTFPNSEVIEPPSTLLWAWYLRAVMHEIVDEFTMAIDLAEKCLDQTPTGVDLYELKGRLLKKAGGILAAAECLDKGRELDMQDRYICNQTTKYFLQADKEETAFERMSLFTKHENDPEHNISEMQVTWYELEIAACLARKSMWGKSLKWYKAVESHFEDIHEDQFDFHSYSIRKVTLRSYVDVLRWEDTIWGHETYATAAEGIIRNYLHLHRNPVKAKTQDGPDYGSMTPAERKKAKAIARKKKKKAEKKIEEANNNKVEGSKIKKAKDEDPDGLELLKKDPLEEGKKYAATLVRNAPNRIGTWLCQYDICARRGKATMALQALCKAKALDRNCENGAVFCRIIDFCQNVHCVSSNESVRDIFSRESSKLLGNKSLCAFIEEWSEKVTSNPRCNLALRTEVAKAMVLCSVGCAKDASNIIIQNGLEVRGVTLFACKEVLTFLENIGDDVKRDLDKFKGLVMTRYPLAAL